MLCEKCQSRSATVHMTKIVNGHKTEIRLCSQCAKENNEFGLNTDLNLNLQDFISTGLLKFEPNQKLVCEKCGLDYTTFNNKGRLGCAKCYDFFGAKLNPILKRIHGNQAHTGKIPKRAGVKLRALRTIQDLKNSLKQAIEVENFEKAAELRDQIKDLEQNQGGGE